MLRNAGGIEYELTYKKVKRVNLRVRPDGSVAVSAPRRMPVGGIDLFVAAHGGWVSAARERLQTRAAQKVTDCTDAECIQLFQPVLDRFYPLVAQQAPEKPSLRVRLMKSRWGVCYPAKNTITLNKQLFDKPFAALEYVVLHELVHLLHPNHQAGFHAEMARLMPDYKQRRSLLK